MNKIFSKLAFNKDKTLKNRLAVAPMTTQQSKPDGSISQEEADWLIRLSEDGYGMVISCAASVSDTATAFFNQLSLAHDEFVPELKKLADTMKNNGSLNLIQLCHAGSRAIEKLTGEKPHSASSYRLPMIADFEPPLELSKSQIRQIAIDFANACERAEKAGFDGVELHGANGYLFTQFISKMTNLRTDEYGGNLANRARFSREVVKACRNRVSDNFIIGFRMSFENAGMETGLDIDENIQIANWLFEDGIDYLHISHLFYSAESVKYPEKIALKYIRENVDKRLPVICAGSIFSVEDANDALALGADIIAIGRAAIGNIDLPACFSDGKSLKYFTPFDEDYLKDIGISNGFIDYLKNAPPLASLNIVKQ